jgi:hypothetical protein
MLFTWFLASPSRTPEESVRAEMGFGHDKKVFQPKNPSQSIKVFQLSQFRCILALFYKIKREVLLLVLAKLHPYSLQRTSATHFE